MAIAFNKPLVCPVLIGRTTELAAFHQLIDQAKSDQGQVALLSGEAGIGKSRLVAEVKTYTASQDFLLTFLRPGQGQGREVWGTRPAQILQGSCIPTDLLYPCAPLLDLLRSFLTRPHDKSGNYC